ncbi:MAG TPA: chemotaxis protein CheX [Terriglobales bacterium]|nr:chemotaxis protein CheX [Terriglobales bacterium]
MKMELIQPFINAADAVLAQTLKAPTTIGEVSMEEDAYRRKGVAALVRVAGDIEGRVIFDLEPSTAEKVAIKLVGDEANAQEIIPEAICELANQVIGNAVTVLNDQGFHFKVMPPEIHTAECGDKSSEDVEALVMSFETVTGSVFMNIAMRYNKRRRADGHGATAD